MASEGVTRVVKLGSDKYIQWSLQIEHLMKSKRCWGAISPPPPISLGLSTATARPPPEAGAVDDAACQAADILTAAAAAAAAASGTTRPATTSDAEKEAQAMVLMVMNVEQQHYATFRVHPSARGAWEALANCCRSRGPARALNLRRQLNMIKMAHGEDPVTYFNRAQTITWELGMLGINIDDGHLLSALLSGLPPKHHDARRFLSLQRGLIVDEAPEDLMAAEAREELEGGEVKGKSDGIALAAARPYPRDPAKEEQFHKDRRARACFHCHKTGHRKRDCPDLTDGGQGGGGGQLAGMAMMAMIAQPPTASTWQGPTATQWLIDSGASQHTTGFAAKLSNVHHCHPVEITMANDDEGTAITEGTAYLQIHSERGAQPLTLSNVLVVPGLAASLFSVHRAAGRGFRTVFTKSTAIIRKGRTILRGVRVGSLYALQEEARLS